MQLEDLRTSLMASLQMNESDLFAAIDRRRNDRVVAEDLIQFLGVHRVAANERECSFLIWIMGAS